MRYAHILIFCWNWILRWPTEMSFQWTQNEMNSQTWFILISSMYAVLCTCTAQCTPTRNRNIIIYFNTVYSFIYFCYPAYLCMFLCASPPVSPSLQISYHITSVLYGNKIKNLPTNVFRGLTSLQLLLLNANEISCIRKDTFKDLNSLSLLSLYDNNIQSLANGTFDAMKSIQTL